MIENNVTYAAYYKMNSCRKKAKAHFAEFYQWNVDNMRKEIERLMVFNNTSFIDEAVKKAKQAEKTDITEKLPPDLVADILLIWASVAEHIDKKLEQAKQSCTTEEILALIPQEIPMGFVKERMGEGLFIIHRFIRHEGDELFDFAYAVLQPNQKWVWVVFGISSMTEGNNDFFDMDDCIDNYIEFMEAWTE